MFFTNLSVAEMFCHYFVLFISFLIVSLVICQNLEFRQSKRTKRKEGIMKVLDLLLIYISIMSTIKIVDSLETITPTPLQAPALSNWKIQGVNWRVNQQNGIISSICMKDTPSTLDTGFWRTSNANRIFLRVITETGGYCLVNKTENTTCQFRLSYTRTNSSTPQYVSNYNVVNATAFPRNTFFNSSNVDNIEKIQNNTFFIENMTDFTGIHFRLETVSYCGTIKQINLNYYQCPKVSENLVNFNKTAAPDIYTQVEKVWGECTENAVMRSGVDRPRMDCWFNGTFEIHGSCVCDAGYTRVGTECSREYNDLMSLTHCFF